MQKVNRASLTIRSQDLKMSRISSYRFAAMFISFPCRTSARSQQMTSARSQQMTSTVTDGQFPAYQVGVMDLVYCSDYPRIRQQWWGQYILAHKRHKFIYIWPRFVRSERPDINECLLCMVRSSKIRNTGLTGSDQGWQIMHPNGPMARYGCQTS